MVVGKLSFSEIVQKNNPTPNKVSNKISNKTPNEISKSQLRNHFIKNHLLIHSSNQNDFTNKLFTFWAGELHFTHEGFRELIHNLNYFNIKLYGVDIFDKINEDRIYVGTSTQSLDDYDDYDQWCTSMIQYTIRHNTKNFRYCPTFGIDPLLNHYKLFYKKYNKLWNKHGTIKILLNKTSLTQLLKHKINEFICKPPHFRKELKNFLIGMLEK